jgi:hypothetical protein
LILREAALQVRAVFRFVEWTTHVERSTRRKPASYRRPWISASTVRSCRRSGGVLEFAGSEPLYQQNNMKQACNITLAISFSCAAMGVAAQPAVATGIAECAAI